MSHASSKSIPRWPVLTLVAAIAIGNTLLSRKLSASESESVSQARSLSVSFRAAAEKIKPTVLKIITSTKPPSVRSRPGTSPDNNPFIGTPFEEFFGEDQSRSFRLQRPLVPRDGVGSGVILDKSSIILTKNHVIDGADEVRVELLDGRQFKATKMKTDEQSDLALIWIKANGPLPAARLGDSDQLETGAWVLAVGSPFGLEQTVSAGIISGKGRTLTRGKRTDFLQIDAAINPGNSGGPLVSLDGEVVGINTAIVSGSGAYQGIGFAIPSNLAKWVKRQLIENGSVQRGYLGVGIREITVQLADKLSLAPKRGVLVSEVFPETPAEKAGFQPGDVILAFAGRNVDSPRQLQEVVERSPAGSKQNVGLLRNGKLADFQVVVRPLPEGFAVASQPAAGGQPN